MDNNPHDRKASHMAKVLADLIEDRDSKVAELEQLTAALEQRSAAWESLPAESRGAEPTLTDEEEARSRKLLKKIDSLEADIEAESRAERKRQQIAEARKLISGAARPSDASVTKEPMIYGPDNPDNSFYGDLCRRALSRLGGGPDGGSEERLAIWAHQVEVEVASGSKEGKRAFRQLRELYRESGTPDQVQRILSDHESRGRTALDQKGEFRTGITTGGGATASAGGGGGAAFVSPAIFVDDYAPYREAGRAFVDQCNKQPLPSFGMEVYLPQVTGPAGVAEQTEGSGVQETDPTMGYLNGSVITEAGEVTVTQQLLDRAGPNFSFDRLIFDQLNRDYNPKVDTYGLTTVVNAAHSQSWSGSSNTFVLVPPSGSLPGSGGFIGQLGKAKAYIKTTAGTFLAPSHAFYQPARWEYIEAWADSNGRPVVVPNYAGPYNVFGGGSPSGDAGVIEGNTGFKLGGLPAFTDSNIPNQGTTTLDQVIVGDLAEVYWYEGEPVTRVIPQTYAQNLQVLLQMYAYMTCIVRYPNGVVVITGTGLSAISYTD